MPAVQVGAYAVSLMFYDILLAPFNRDMFRSPPSVTLKFIRAEADDLIEANPLRVSRNQNRVDKIEGRVKGVLSSGPTCTNINFKKPFLALEVARC